MVTEPTCKAPRLIAPRSSRRGFAGADFRGAELRGAYVSANLVGADSEGAELYGAPLHGGGETSTRRRTCAKRSETRGRSACLSDTHGRHSRSNHLPHIRLNET